ncbi:MAG: hypothetical protein E7311_05420 [Clostridiales bacterium]|nr:hypothetical protein [Clostridiales bacterium]
MKKLKVLPETALNKANEIYGYLIENLTREEGTAVPSYLFGVGGRDFLKKVFYICLFFICS